MEPNHHDSCPTATSIEVVDGVVASFETERLSARRLDTSDASWLAELHRDPVVMATLGGVRTEAQSAEFLTTNIDHWETHGFGQWMLRTDGDRIGRGGLRMIHPSVGEELVEVGYGFAAAVWGMGFATEATRAFVEIAFNHYELPQLGAITLEHNQASARVLEKCGFRFERWVDHPAGRHKFLRLVA